MPAGCLDFFAEDVGGGAEPVTTPCGVRSAASIASDIANLANCSCNSAAEATTASAPASMHAREVSLSPTAV